jgi:hypothetical protein
MGVKLGLSPEGKVLDGIQYLRESTGGQRKQRNEELRRILSGDQIKNEVARMGKRKNLHTKC